MRSSQQGRVGYGLAVAAATALFGCRPAPPPEQHFYDVHIQPILNASCVGNTSPCHSIAVDPVTNSPTALGNLDLSSFEGVQKRRDVLRTYGSYPQPLLLLKAMPPGSNQIPYQGKFYPSEIQHSGGSPIQPNSEAYFELKNWLDNGANRDGIAPQAVAEQGCWSLQRRASAGQPAHHRRRQQPSLPGLQGQHRADARIVVRLRQLPQLAAGRHVPDLRSGRQRSGRRDRLQLRAGGGLRDRAARRPDDRWSTSIRARSSCGRWPSRPAA